MLAGKKVLITGLTGQVGAAIASALAPRCEMWGFARYTRPGSLKAAEAMGVRTVVGDIALGEFSNVPDDFDYILHFAAVTKPASAEEGMVQNAEATGLLMQHCRKAKAFLFVSTTACYLDHPDPFHVYTEADHLGGSTLRAPNYGASKIAGEGVVRTLARILGLPATIARLNVSYGGPYDDGGLPGAQLEALIQGRSIDTPTRPCMHAPVHEDDLAEHIVPLLRAASVPATIVNWGGPDPVSVVDWVRYLGELTGREPKFNFSNAAALPNCIPDISKGRQIGLGWKVRWREGMRRMVEARHPEAAMHAGAGPSART